MRTPPCAHRTPAVPPQHHAASAPFIVRAAHRLPASVATRKRPAHKRRRNLSHVLPRRAAFRTLLPATALAACALSGGAVRAQTPAVPTGSVTLYGNVEQYVNYMRSNSGTHFTSLEDGAYLRSRFGFRGVENLGGGYSAKFQLEGGFSGDTGGMADTTRAFDRQSWVGIAGPAGEVRLGRQNGPILTRGGYIDHTTRTLGSMVNNFGVPSRYDNDIAYLSPRVAGFAGEVHYALPEVNNSASRQAVYQGAVDYIGETVRLGYIGLRGRPPANALYHRDVVYDNLFANYVYSKGTVYLTYVRSNNVTSNANGNNAGSILGNVGGVVAGTNPDVNNFYRILQLSADYQLTNTLRLGALWGRIEDQSGNGRNANGGTISAYYDMSKRTTLFAMANTLRNDNNAGFRPSGSAGLKTNFTGGDVNGRTINGVQVGILHRF
ncbi:porin [Xylophilus sp. Kf1]|nr:porin [Xylophilus sp. Kf1]